LSTLARAAAAPLPLQTPRPLNDHIALALPQPAKQPNPMVLPAAYAAPDQAMLSQTAATAPQQEEELLGAP
ncbi:MAG: hypothetical protein ABUS57_13700, partial [Pseudomonadota bacterium]